MMMPHAVLKFNHCMVFISLSQADLQLIESSIAVLLDASLARRSSRPFDYDSKARICTRFDNAIIRAGFREGVEGAIAPLKHASPHLKSLDFSSEFY